MRAAQSTGARGVRIAAAVDDFDAARIDLYGRQHLRHVRCIVVLQLRLGDLADFGALQFDRATGSKMTTALEQDAVDERRPARILGGVALVGAGVQTKHRSLPGLGGPSRRGIRRIESDAARTAAAASDSARKRSPWVPDRHIHAARIPETRLRMYQMLVGGTHEGIDFDLLGTPIQCETFDFSHRHSAIGNR